MISHKYSAIMQGVDKVYILKEDHNTKKTYYETRRYLVAKVGNHNLPYGSVTEWYISGDDYVNDSMNE